MLCIQVLKRKERKREVDRDKGMRGGKKGETKEEGEEGNRFFSLLCVCVQLLIYMWRPEEDSKYLSLLLSILPPLRQGLSLNLKLTIFC